MATSRTPKPKRIAKREEDEKAAKKAAEIAATKRKRKLRSS